MDLKKIIYFLPLILLFSCEMKKRSPASIEEIILTESLGPERDLDTDESNIALRICYAFKSKRNYLRTFKIGSDFDFQIHEKTCNGTENSHMARVKLFEHPQERHLEFRGEDKQVYLSKVMTDRHGPMSYLCTALFRGKDVPNTYLKNETQKFQFEFSSNDETDVVKIIHGVKGVDNFGGVYYSISYVDTYQLESTPHKSEFTGVAVKAMRSFPCGQSGGTNDLVQELLTD
jgi:hypothetical protein